ncbi:MAG: PSD1 and planctomycete cytochrome C domain-containing protein [Saprospiraceae bacterium]|nr:PSD1 and planctomycete cytochrome C domain-containing protein [Saprospiraceae bacterium]
MRNYFHPIFLILLFLLSCQKDHPNSISFNQYIRPILNENCLNCHGGVKKLGEFSLLFEEEAFAKTESGKPAIIPGDHKNSELYKRLIDHDPDNRMPQESPPLNQKDIDLIARWIDEGAQWETHWAYIPPAENIKVPKFNSDWATHEIDYFVLEKLSEKGLKPTAEAAKETLVRRIYLDLIGLPPTPEEAQAFLKDNSTDAYERMVDRLLDSSHFGEHWAAIWMDLARYGDSQGYQKDPIRPNIWRYRDWVIDAFNRDLTFDEFTVEQLAGDLLENRTDNQLLATTFHRNTNTNDEGGTDNEEFRTYAVMDRMSTTFEVWQGTTMACVQCHSHPYDPFRHEEYYELLAFFNQTQDADLGSEIPKASLLSPGQKLEMEALKKSISEIQKTSDTLSENYIKQVEKLASIQPGRVPVMLDLEDSTRTCHIFERGNWLVKGEEVQPNVPKTLPKLTAKMPSNRLGLAKWLVSPENPLTARVTVNRFWASIFGKGLVETLEDFGTQGTPPTHPELLDWLSVQFQKDWNWSVKRLLREIVLSATYRQSSAISKKALAIDPNNRWLGRAPRFRLSAEQIRDQALAVSGLLNRKIFGPSVMPHQPDGVWEVIRNALKWRTSQNGEQYRRGLYTFWRKTSPYPSMVSFDSPSREFCVSRRVRTNTPLQSLTTLNDPVFVEAAEALAIKMIDFESKNLEDKLSFGFELVLFKKPDLERLEVLKDFFEKALVEYQKDDNPNSELQAMTNLAGVILNLGEVLVRG